MKIYAIYTSVINKIKGKSIPFLVVIVYSNYAKILNSVNSS